MNVGYKLLFQYLFLYPIYYIVAMLIAAGILMLMMSWSMEVATKFFIIMAVIMGVSSYFIHWRIGYFALSEIRCLKRGD